MNGSMYLRARSVTRRGLTLIELVIVMVILAAVAGIVLPLLPSMITRAHTSTSATNIGEVAKAVQMFEAVNYAYPTNFDSLMVGSTLASYIPDDASNISLSTTALSTTTANALINSGIVSVRTMTNSTVGGDWDPTFYPYGSVKTVVPGITTVTSGLTLPVLTTTAAGRLGLSSPLTTQYLVLGMGNFTSMQGKTLQEAPVHFSDVATEAPNLKYARYGVVFQVTDATGVTALKKAKLVQIVAFHSDGVVGSNAHLSEYYESATGAVK